MGARGVVALASVLLVAGAGVAPPAQAAARTTYKVTRHQACGGAGTLTTCPSQFHFRLQKQVTSRSGGGSDEPTSTLTWRTLPRTYHTKGTSRTLTVNQPKGTYRALVGGACLLADTQSPVATLTKKPPEVPGSSGGSRGVRAGASGVVVPDVRVRHRMAT